MSRNEPAIAGYCPVAYFLADRPLKGSPDHVVTHRGETYWFLNAEVKAAFEADPDKYVPAYGGACAYGMSIGKRFPVDPTSYRLVDGRLLLFHSSADVDAQALWNDKDDASQVEKADAHFEALARGGDR